jgi:uncharacterized membrane protein YgdD (TMEM256/DUF423 family)
LYLCGGIAGFIGVALGALGAHGLKSHLSAQMLAVFETGVRYQMYHAFALFAVAWAWSRWQHRAFAIAGWLFAAGIILFSGSLYLLTLLDSKWLGTVTPLGGFAFLAGWTYFVWGAWNAGRKR